MKKIAINGFGAPLIILIIGLIIAAGAGSFLYIKNTKNNSLETNDIVSVDVDSNSDVANNDEIKDEEVKNNSIVDDIKKDCGLIEVVDASVNITGEVGSSTSVTSTSAVQYDKKSQEALKCFDNEFKKCIPGKTVIYKAPVLFFYAEFKYEVLGIKNSLCQLKQTAIQWADPKTIGKSMVCLHKTGIGLTDAMSDIKNCSGEFFDLAYAPPKTIPKNLKTIISTYQCSQQGGIPTGVENDENGVCKIGQEDLGQVSDSTANGKHPQCCK